MCNSWMTEEKQQPGLGVALHYKEIRLILKLHVWVLLLLIMIMMVEENLQYTACSQIALT